MQQLSELYWYKPEKHFWGDSYTHGALAFSLDPVIKTIINYINIKNVIIPGFDVIMICLQVRSLQCHEELRGLHSSRNTVRIIQSRTLKWVVKYAWKGRGLSYGVLAEDLKKSRPLEISHCKFQINIKLRVKVVEWNHPKQTETNGGLL